MFKIIHTAIGRNAFFRADAVKITLYCCMCLAFTLKPYEVAFASDTSHAANRLKNGFFPKYLSNAYSSYLGSNAGKCFENLDHLKVDSYTSEPEKYFLLKALCAPSESQPAAAKELVAKALKQRGSSSDVLYAAGIIFTQLAVFDEGLKQYQEAKWYNNFEFFNEKDFYQDLGILQHKLSLLGEARVSLEHSQQLGNSDIVTKLLLTDIAIRTGDRRSAITSARQLTALKNDETAKQMLLLALMVAADPVLHKRDILEATNIAKILAEASFKNADIGVASTKALLLNDELELAQAKLKTSLSANSSDPRLLALQTQIENELKSPSD